MSKESSRTAGVAASLCSRAAGMTTLLSDIRKGSATPEVHEALEVASKAFRVCSCLLPVKPVQRGVMAVGVVVPSLQQNQA